VTKRHFLQVRAIGVASVVSVNDARVVVDLDAEGMAVTDPVDTWIKPRENTLAVDLNWPEGHPFVAGRASVEVELFAADPASERPKPGRVLARAVWPPPAQLDREEDYPIRLEEMFEVEAPPPTRLWQEAEVVTSLGDWDRQEIFARVDRLQRALMTAQAEDAYTLLAYRYAEEARAEGKPEGRIKSAVLEGYRDMFGLGHLDFAPVGEEHLALRPHADQQVVQLTRQGRPFAIMALHRASGTGFGIPVYLARVRGEWTIVR